MVFRVVAAAPAPALPDLGVPESGGVTAPKKRQLFPETWLWDLVLRYLEFFCVGFALPTTL